MIILLRLSFSSDCPAFALVASLPLPPYDNYGQFSEFQIYFCGLDPGKLKFETVRTAM